MNAPAPHPPAFHAHDHEACIAGALDRAEALARERGLRLTPVRRRVLELLLERHGAMGAYEVLERLAAEGYGHQPPVAYRALEFLVAQGLAHRIRRLNAFAACARPGEAHHAAFLICEGCQSVAEVPAEALRSLMDSAAAEMGFAVARASIEAVGRCATCAEASQ
jgi:Fur family transcriptional regulator, zinc uptake regulator